MSRYTFRFHLLLALLLLLNAVPVMAIGKRDMPVSRLIDGERLEISPGYGLTINIMPIGKVNRAWLTDKSWMTIANENGACPNGGCGQSRFIYLQRIDTLRFNGLPRAVDGGTLLNLVTVNGEILQFHIVRDRDGIPAYTSVYVQPEQPKPEPVAALPPRALPTPAPPPAVPVTEIPISVLIDQGEASTTPPEEKTPEPKAQKKSEDKSKEIALETETETLPEEKVAPHPPEEEVPPADVQPNKETQTDEEQEDAAVLASAQTAEPPQSKTPKAKPQVKSQSSQANKTAKEKGESDAGKVDSTSKKADEPVVLAKSTDKTTPNATNQEIAGAVLRGLHSQQGKREVGRSIHYYRAQDLIYLLKRYPRLSLERAIREARMDATVAKTLIQYGSK